MEIQPHKVKIEELRRRFLQETLEDNADIIYQEQEREAAAKLVKRTGNLTSKRTRSIEPKGQAGQALELGVIKYLRFHDIRGRDTRNRRKGSFKRPKETSKSKKAVQIYNRIIYGRLANIAGRVQYGFTQEIIDLMEKSSNFRKEGN